MRLRRLGLLALTVAVVAASGCGGSVKSHTDAGPTLDPNTQCIGGTSTHTRGELGAIASGTGGACASSQDLDAVCTNTVSEYTGTCGKDCYLNDPTATDDVLLACTTDCVLAQTDPDPSRECVDCYSKATECARKHCLVACLPGFTPACYDCRAANNCVADFTACAGFPPAPRPPDDAGMGDAGSDAGSDAGYDAGP